MKYTSTVFIPVYNEEEIIARNVNRLFAFMESASIDAEIIIGSNGSTDNTPKIVKELDRSADRIQAFHLDRRGVGRAFSRAVKLARADYIVCQDADLAVELDFIPLALEFLEKCDIVVGCKRLGLQKRSFFRKFGSDFFVFVSSLLLGAGVSDFSIGAKAYRREFVSDYTDRLDPGTGYVLELVYLAATEKRRVVELPVNCRDNRKSHFNLPAEAAHKFSHLFRLWLKKSWERKTRQCST